MLFKKSTKVFIHVDCDSFFASCEVKRNPQLTGKYVCVGGDIVIACTYNCKALGIKTGTPVWEAKKILKGHGVFLPPDHQYYTQVSDALFEYLRSKTAGFEAFSIDEAFCDITGIAQYYKISLGKFLKNMQQEILSQIGIPVSIGCSETRIKAKMFSKINKPFGIYIGFDQKKEHALFQTLPSKSIPFIGKAYYQRIRSKAPTVYDFMKVGYRYLQSTIGKNATDLRLELMGVNAFVVKKSLQAKSISRTRSFNKNITNNFDFLKSQLHIHFERIFEEIVKNNIEVRSIVLIYRTKDFKIENYHYNFLDYTNIRSDIWNIVTLIFHATYKETSLYRTIGLSILDFRSYLPRQTSLFDTPLRSKDHKYLLSKTIENINHKYGVNKISYGTSLLGKTKDVKLGIRQ